MDEYYHGIEKVSDGDFARLLHGNRSIKLNGEYNVGDELIIAGPYVVKTKIKGKYNGKYKVSKAIRVDIYGGLIMSSSYNIVVQTLKLVDDDEGYPDYAEVIKTEYTGGDWQETKANLEDIYNKNVKAFEEFAEVDSKIKPAYDKYHKAIRKYNDYERMAKTLSDTIDSIPRVSDIDGKAVLASTEAEAKKLHKEVDKLGEELQKIKDDAGKKYDILEDSSQDGIYGLATPGNMKAKYDSFQDWLNSNEGSISLSNYLEDNGWRKVEPTGLEVNEVDPWDF